MIKTIKTDNEVHIIKKTDNVLHEHYITHCGLIASGTENNHFISRAEEIDGICQLCINAKNAIIQGIEHENTGTIHVIDPIGENYEGFIISFCGMQFQVGLDDVLLDVESIIQIETDDVTCKRCLRSNRFKEKTKHNLESAHVD